MKYRLLKDCPMAKAESIWETNNTDPVTAFMSGGGMGFHILRSEIPIWFEEVEEIPKFTKKQTRYLLSKLYKATEKYDHAGDMYEFVKAWVKENTET